ncbi:glycoside hydrolase family 3 N-terminal domain-containing protein [Haladaptatus sp. CMAA 1911]|uniref:glycoside hydrolase family 3 N-terminal domain-containing protein n=1 Tax=unclassified Haladaptatus TaxID=2622732 RepID=UPI0037543598
MNNDPVYFDSSTSTEDRVTDLLDRMTLREKVGQMVGMHVGSFSDTQRKDPRETTLEDVEEAIRNHTIGSTTPFGTGFAPYNTVAVAGQVANRLQRVAVNETRLGIPLLIPVDAIHGHANIEGSTVFPHNLGMASTWNADLINRAARVTAIEMSATGANQNYSPTADIAREPRWGRTYETYGESPHLVGELVAAEIRGLQGEDLTEHTAVAATVKHYPASSDPTRGEDTAPVDISMGTLRRVFLPPFERAIDEDVAALMPMYNAIGNEPAHASEFYLTEMLRSQLGFDGVVCSDWLGVWMLTERHRTADSLTDAIEQVTTAGLDIASVGGPQHAEMLFDLVKSGIIHESLIDRSVRRILRLKFELGLFEDPYVSPEFAIKSVGSDAHRQVAREAAQRSIILLQNRDEALPMTSANELFITGPNADSLDNLLGGWTVLGFDESYGPTVRKGLEEAVDSETNVAYEPGIRSGELSDPAKVSAKARNADVTVVVLGEPWYLHEFGLSWMNDATDGFPRRNQLGLPNSQRNLLEAVDTPDTTTILVVVTGRPLILTEAIDHADGVIMAFFPGIEGGRAIADVLLGDCNPSGRLPISVPRSIGDLPVRHDWLPHPSPIGSGAHLPSYDPLFEFGFGLSYTEFTYESIELSEERISDGEEVTVEVTVTNSGDRDGIETVQLFGQHLRSSVVTPVRELKGFAQANLSSGETKTVQFTLSATDLAVIGPDGTRSIESGQFELYVDNLSKVLTIE